jgi:hypothetical protein
MSGDATHQAVEALETAVIEIGDPAARQHVERALAFLRPAEIAAKATFPRVEVFMTEQDFAERYHVGRRTAQRWRRTGEGPAWVRWGPRAIRYRVSDVERWAAGRTFQHRADELARQVQTGNADRDRASRPPPRARATAPG